MMRKVPCTLWANGKNNAKGGVMASYKISLLGGAADGLGEAGGAPRSDARGSVSARPMLTAGTMTGDETLLLRLVNGTGPWAHVGEDAPDTSGPRERLGGAPRWPQVCAPRGRVGREACPQDAGSAWRGREGRRGPERPPGRGRPSPGPRAHLILRSLSLFSLSRLFRTRMNWLKKCSWSLRFGTSRNLRSRPCFSANSLNVVLEERAPLRPRRAGAPRRPPRHSGGPEPPPPPRSGRGGREAPWPGPQAPPPGPASTSRRLVDGGVYGRTRRVTTHRTHLRRAEETVRAHTGPQNARDLPGAACPALTHAVPTAARGLRDHHRNTETRRPLASI